MVTRGLQGSGGGLSWSAGKTPDLSDDFAQTSYLKKPIQLTYIEKQVVITNNEP